MAIKINIDKIGFIKIIRFQLKKASWRRWIDWREIKENVVWKGLIQIFI